MHQGMPGNGSENHTADEAEVDGALAQVHERPDRPHHHGCHEVAGDGGRGLDAEKQDQHGCHQCPTTCAGHSNQEAHDGTPKHNVWVDAHPCPLDGLSHQPNVKSLNLVLPEWMLMKRILAACS